MDKEQVQEQELSQVGGGMQYFQRCQKCYKMVDSNATYPEGSFVRTEKNSWCIYVTYRKCPNCGAEWRE